MFIILGSTQNKLLLLLQSQILRFSCELIHCFKENQPCSAGLQRLKVMENTIDDEREDPFVSLSDSHVEQEAINESDSDDEK